MGYGGHTFMAYGRYGLVSFDCTYHNKEVYARLGLTRFTKRGTFSYAPESFIQYTCAKEISDQTFLLGHYYSGSGYETFWKIISNAFKLSYIFPNF